MEMLSILETLEDLIEKSSTVPFTGKSMVDREEILEIVKEIRLKLPDDISDDMCNNQESCRNQARFQFISGN